MRTVDQPEEQIGLGPVKRPEPKPQEPKRVADGIMQGPDGKLYTDGPNVLPSPSIADLFRKGYRP